MSVADVIFKVFIIPLESHHPKDRKNGKLFGFACVVYEVVHHRFEVVNWCTPFEEGKSTDKVFVNMFEKSLDNNGRSRQHVQDFGSILITVSLA